MSEEALASFEYPSAKVFVTLLEAVGEVADEILLRLEPNGAKVRALDPARISLIELEIPASAFTSYTAEKEISVGINLSSLLKIFPKPKKSEALKFFVDEAFYTLVIEGTTPRSFRFRSIEVPVEEIPELKLEFSVRAILLSKAMKQALNSLRGAGVIEVEVPTSDYMLLKGGGTSVKLSRISGSIIDIEFKEPTRSAYEENYLMKVDPLLGLTEKLEFSFKSSSPLSMTFQVPGDIIVRYTLAPQA